MRVPLKLQLEQAIHLKNVLEALTDMFSVTNFHFSVTGCEIQAVDTSGVARVTLVAFLHGVSASRDISMGLNLADMATAFRLCNGDDEVTIVAEEGSFVTFRFKFKSPKIGGISYFYVDNVVIQGKPLQIEEPSESSEYQYQAIVRLPSAVFMNVCEQLSSFSDRKDRETVVIISLDKEGEGACFFARGEKATSKIVYLAAHIVMKEKVSQMFALRYIKAFSKVSTLSDQVTICLSSKKAAVFKCETTGMGNIRYYISPVYEIQNEEDEMQRIARYYMQAVPMDEDEMQNE